MIGLVACCKTKLTKPAKAKELYCSPLFIKAMNYCLAYYDGWFILSAKHGLVNPETVLAPYEYTLLNQTKQVREIWGRMVYEQIADLNLTRETFSAHAGAIYITPLASKLEIKTPLAGLPIGKQLAWYGETTNTITQKSSHRLKRKHG